MDMVDREIRFFAIFEKFSSKMIQNIQISILFCSIDLSIVIRQLSDTFCLCKCQQTSVYRCHSSVFTIGCERCRSSIVISFQTHESIDWNRQIPECGAITFTILRVFSPRSMQSILMKSQIIQGDPWMLLQHWFPNDFRVMPSYAIDTIHIRLVLDCKNYSIIWTVDSI